MMSRVLPVDLNHRQSRADSEAAATWFKVPKILLSSPSVTVGRGIYHYISRTRSVAGLAGRAEYISVTVGREPRRPGDTKAQPLARPATTTVTRRRCDCDLVRPQQTQRSRAGPGACEDRGRHYQSSSEMACGVRLSPSASTQSKGAAQAPLVDAPLETRHWQDPAAAVRPPGDWDFSGLLA